jgi:hypothetical protein
MNNGYYHGTQSDERRHITNTMSSSHSKYVTCITSNSQLLFCTTTYEIVRCSRSAGLDCITIIDCSRVGGVIVGFVIRLDDVSTDVFHSTMSGGGTTMSGRM